MTRDHQGDKNRDEPDSPPGPEAGPTVSDDPEAGNDPTLTLPTAGLDIARKESSVAGGRVGRYLIIEPIGHGGMGVVYKAYDPELDRRVAIKVLRKARSERARVRLQREAQALARLSHRNVVAVHDVGEVDGSVFVAMEYLEGETLHQWQKKSRSLAETLEVYSAAGQGLLAAHRAGLVHRDFKPGNVIVGSDGRVCVLDFGLARAAELHSTHDDTMEEAVDQADTLLLDDDQHGLPEDQPSALESLASEGRRARAKAAGQAGALAAEASEDKPSESSVSSSGHRYLDIPLTAVGALVGTPSYMAPEQFVGSVVDSRTDQFSYCVALYEALCGKRPFAEDRENGWPRRRIFTPVDAAVLKEVQVPGWVQRVLLRGLSLEPDQRYPSMDEVLEALQTDPRVKLRNRLMTVAAIVLVAAAIAALLVAVKSDPPVSCDPPADALAGIWDPPLADDIAKAFAASDILYAGSSFDRVRLALDSYTEDWRAAYSRSCTETHHSKIYSADILDLRMGCLQRGKRALAALTEKLRDNITATTIDNAIIAVLDLPATARCSDIEALKAETPPPEDPALRQRVTDLQSQLDDVRALDRLGLFKDSLAMVGRLSKEVEETRYSPLVAELLLEQGRLYIRTGEFDKAEEILYRALEQAALARDSDLYAAASVELLAAVAESQIRLKEAPSLIATTKAAAHWVDERAATRGQFHLINASVHRVAGKYDQARGHYERALTIYEESRGKDSDEVADVLDALGFMYVLQAKYDQARVYQERALDISRKLYGPDHPNVASVLGNISIGYLQQGKFDESRQGLEEVLEIFRTAYGPDHPSVGTAFDTLAMVHRHQGNLDKARELHEKGLEIRLAKLGADHPHVAASLDNLASVLRMQDDFAGAEERFRQALEMRERTLGPEHSKVGITVLGLGQLAASQGKHDEARRHFERAAGIIEKAEGPEHPVLGQCLIGLGTSLLALGQTARSVAALERAVSVIEAGTPEDPRDLPRARLGLARAQWQLGGGRNRAIDLAQRAHQGFIAAGEPARDNASETKAWLCERNACPK